MLGIHHICSSMQTTLVDHSIAAADQNNGDPGEPILILICTVLKMLRRNYVRTTGKKRHGKCMLLFEHLLKRHWYRTRNEH
jgi:hypothetical protein